MSALQHIMASPPRLMLILPSGQQPEQAIVLHPGAGQVAYPSLDLALDALRAEVAP